LENFEKIPQDLLTKVPIIYTMGSIRKTKMTLAKFITYIQYSVVCPDRIHPARWNGMIKYAKKNGFIS
jgi:hypothetical protein